jgi:cyclophilin family peptidyl-prolyl cis-trans isomerase
MNEKNFTIFFIIALVIGAGTLMFSKFQETSPSPSPTPSSGVNFNSSSQPSAQATPQPSIKQYKSFPTLSPEQLKNKKAQITTPKGRIDIELYPEATKAASNFLFLSGEGFYNGLTFHRVEKGFVIQGGDPNGNGTGGPGYKFEDELADKRTYTKGTVAMANSGPNTNGSQFFIMLADHPELPHNYTIFGKVTSGMEVVDKIVVGDLMQQIVIK